MPQASLLSFAAVLDPLRAANRLAAEPVFDWQLLSPDGEPVELTCGISISVDAALSGKERGDLLLIVAAFNPLQHASRSVLQKLNHAVQGFPVVAGVESGSWLLARAGLVSQRAITTHWEEREELHNAFPTIDLRPDRYVIDGRIWTAGGASPALDMMLHFIRQTQHASLAIDVASVFIYDEAHSATDAQPNLSFGRLESLEPRVAAAARLMEKHIEEPIGIDAICRRLKISRKTLELLFRRHLKETPAAYYRRIRLQVAHKLLRDSLQELQEISVRCGFNSQSAFSRAFKRAYGCAPQSLRKHTTNPTRA